MQRNDYIVLFEKDFRTKAGNTSLDGFQVENLIQNQDLCAMRSPEGYTINFPFPGNIHFLRVPEQRDFIMEAEVSGNPDFPDYEAAVVFQIYYRYDQRSRQGGVLRVGRTDRRWTVLSGKVNGRDFEWNEKAEWDSESSSERWKLTVEDSRCIFEERSFAVPAGIPEYGKVGFDKKESASPLFIGFVKFLGAPMEKTMCFSKNEWIFPKEIWNPMSQWKFSFSAENIGDTTILKTGVAGGPTECPNRNIFYTKSLPNEYLENPYFRIVLPDGRIGEKQYIFYGRIGFKENWNCRLPAFPKSDAECPLEQTFYLERLPEHCRLLIGFERHDAEDRQQFLPEGKIMLVDPENGKILMAGEPLDENGLAVSLDSGAKKEICSRIPQSVVDYEDALSYAINNHFFQEEESCCFSVKLRYAANIWSSEELTVITTLENAFFEVMENSGEMSRSGEAQYVLPNERIMTFSCDFGKLPIGVYHAHTKIFFGNSLKKDTVTAFEVLGSAEDSLSPPLASGLPALFSAHTDFQSETNSFDPRSAGNDSIAHYYSISAMQLLPASEKREWELLDLYRRKYMGWFIGRSAPDVSPETNHELISHTDYYFTQSRRIALKSPQAYQGALRDELIDFLNRKNVGNSELAKKATNPEAEFTLNDIRDLFERFGADWLLRVSEWNIARWKEFVEKYQVTNPCGAYAPQANYSHRLKGGFNTLLYGFDLRKHPEQNWYSGYVAFEDYPYLCGYSALSGLYNLAASKLDAPDLKFYPEIYGLCAIPSDTHTVVGSPPYGIMKTGIFPKRIFDYKFTICWYRDGMFHFWKDDGFHLRNPNASEMKGVLEAWGEIRKYSPKRPLRTLAFVTGTSCCIKHKLYFHNMKIYEKPCQEIINTAEEFPAWVNLAIRHNGLPNGFVVHPDELDKLTSDDVHTLVLPPLDALTDDEKAAARKLFEHGVNLVCSECAKGMESVFGVKEMQACKIEYIEGEHSLSGNCYSEWQPDGAETLLADENGTALLTVKKGEKAFAAFYTIAPTMFSRYYIVDSAEQSGKVLERSVADLFSRIVLATEVSISDGRISAFRDRDGSLVIAAMEDAHPEKPHKIAPLLTVNGDFRQWKISSNAEFMILECSAKQTVLRLHLEPEECRIIHFEK